MTEGRAQHRTLQRWHKAGKLCAALVLSAAPALAASPPGTEAAWAFLCGRTVHFYEPLHGNQIEYFAPDGTAYLWYPTEPAPIQGAWLLQIGPEDEAVEVCFRYPPTAWNPVAQAYEGPWHCSAFGTKRLDIVAAPVDGDPFGLRTGAAPERLPARPRADLDALVARLGDGDVTSDETAGCTPLVS